MAAGSILVSTVNAGSGPGRPRPPIAPSQVPPLAAGTSPAPGGRRQSIMDWVKRAASQPTLSGTLSLLPSIATIKASAR